VRSSPSVWSAGSSSGCTCRTSRQARTYRHWTLITGLPEVLISIVKAMTFGLIAGLVGCYRGLTVSGGAKGVGTAVNETLVLCVIALFAVNVILTTIGVRFGTGH